MYGDGSQTRSFCYVDDLVDGMIGVMNQEEEVGPVNLGNAGEFTIRELAEKVIEKTGSASRIVEEPLPEDDPTQRRPDTSLAEKLIDWSPKVELDEGLERTIAYFRENC